MTDAVELEGAFIRAPVGSAWWFASERYTLTGVAVWSLRRPSRRHAERRMALAAFAGADPAPPLLVRWTGLDPPRRSEIPPFRMLDLLEPTTLGWHRAVGDAIAAAAAEAGDDEPTVTDDAGLRWIADVEVVDELERCDGELPLDAAAVATLVQFDADLPADDAPESLWVAGDGAQRAVGWYVIRPHAVSDELAEVDRGGLGRFLVRHTVLGIALGTLLVVVERLI